MLKRKGIQSPIIDGMVEISKGLWVVPNKVKNLDKLKKKYSKKDIIIQKGGYKSKNKSEKYELHRIFRNKEKNIY